eukprot:5443485-Alexandrium_andersonii.AAC.1
MASPRAAEPTRRGVGGPHPRAWQAIADCLIHQTGLGSRRKSAKGRSQSWNLPKARCEDFGDAGAN